MSILHSFEENKLEYEDEYEVEIKMMGTGMDKESLEHNLYKNDITLIIFKGIKSNSELLEQPPLKVGFPEFYKELEAEIFGAVEQLIRIQFLQLELRLGKTPTRSFRPVMSAEILWQF
ncbi:hypothetical protein Tco_1087593 [Tanacetum coccineum]